MRFSRHVTCKSPSPVCNGTGCLSACPRDTSGSCDPSASEAGWAAAPARSGGNKTTATDRPQTVGIGIACFLRPALSCERANAMRLAAWPEHRRSGQMTGHKTPLAPSVNRPNLRNRAGLCARVAVPSRLPVSTASSSLLQHAGSLRPFRGAPARGGGFASVAARPRSAAAPMEMSYGQQDAYRCHPPGGDPGRGGPRIPRRRV